MMSSRLTELTVDSRKNYRMAFTINLRPSGLQFAADADSTVLDSAEKAGIALPYGCRGGSCGACKGRVIEGDVERGIEDQFAMTDAERAAGFVLLCVAQPRSGAVIEVADVSRLGGIVVKTLPSRIISIEHAAPDVLIVALKLPASEAFDFRAGQYITLMFKDGERRDFSLANAPHELGFVQLHIKLNAGSYTARMFNDVLKERDILRFEGPLGSFGINTASTKPMILLAGGTGYAPIKSILDHMAHGGCDGGTRRDVHLYRGAPDRAGLYLPDQHWQWVSAFDNFAYVPVLSDPTPACQWTGRKGLVHQAVLDDFADLSGFEVYACGSPAMIDAARLDFAARGLPPDAFFADAFTPAPATK